MTRAKPARWTVKIPVRAQAMVLANPAIFLAGPPDLVDAQDPLGALEGRKGALLWVASTANGGKIAEYRLEAPPVFDGMAAADNKLFLSLMNGKVVCYGGGNQE